MDVNYVKSQFNDMMKSDHVQSKSSLVSFKSHTNGNSVLSNSYSQWQICSNRDFGTEIKIWHLLLDKIWTSHYHLKALIIILHKSKLKVFYILIYKYLCFFLHFISATNPKMSDLERQIAPYAPH